MEHAPQPLIAKSATTSDPEPSAILVEMKDARVRINGNASSALITTGHTDMRRGMQRLAANSRRGLTRRGSLMAFVYGIAMHQHRRKGRSFPGSVLDMSLLHKICTITAIASWATAVEGTPATAQEKQPLTTTQIYSSIDCRQWSVNPDGTWNGGPHARIGNLIFENTMYHTMTGYADNGIDVGTILAKKCGMPKAH